MNLYWHKIWEKKGKQDTNDLKQLDGFEYTDINSKLVALNISKALLINKNSNILEVGCGSGMIAQHLISKSNLYLGIDYSSSLVKKYIENLKSPAIKIEAANLPFKNKFFDSSFAFSVFHYFIDYNYASMVINEMTRISKNKIFIGDLPKISNRKEHLIYSEDNLSKWINLKKYEKPIITDGFYNKERFNILLTIK